MARTDARSIYDSQDDATKAKLAEANGKLIEGIFANSLSSRLKNKQYSGDPTTGSVEVNRFKNAVTKDYGTARNGNAGEKLHNNGKVTINISTDKEIVEEISKKDLELFGIEGLVESRSANHRKQMEVELDRAFFTEADSVATEVIVASMTADEAVDKVIQTAISTKNDWVDGLDKSDLKITLSVKAYGKLRKYIDTVTRPTADSGTREIKMFHGVEVEENVRQTADIILQHDGAIAQPVLVHGYELEKIPLSNDYALQLFYSYGTKAVAKDLIFKATLA